MYNTNETGLYFRATAECSFVFKKDSVATEKKNKVNNFLVTCNMLDADKRGLLYR